MAEETKPVRILVGIKDLKKGMRIISYIGFNKKYQSINEETCTFIRHNFKNARARIIRQEKELDVQVDQVSPGDTIRRIYKLPPELKKLTAVNEKLAHALMHRGFLKFEVRAAGYALHIHGHLGRQLAALFQDLAGKLSGGNQD